MAFAPKKKARRGGSTPRHKVPNIRIPSKDKGPAVKVPNIGVRQADEQSRYPVMAPDGPVPLCWLCADGCSSFGWCNMPSELSTPSGAALNYFTLCPHCTSAVSQHNMSNTQVMAESNAGGHSDAFVTFLREYKILLELVAVEKAKVASVTMRKEASVCYDLGTLRRLLSCVDGALSTYGLTMKEKGLLGMELSNLQEQAQIVSSKRSPQAVRHNPPTSVLNASYSREPEEKSATPVQEDLGNVSWERHMPAHTPVMPPSMPTHVPPSMAPSMPPSVAAPLMPTMDMEFTLQLQEEMTRLQQSNSEALQKLSMLSRQHRELSVEHTATLDSLRAATKERDMLRERESELVSKCQQLTAEAMERGRNARRREGTEFVITDLRQRALEAEKELVQRPEASRDEIRQSQEARMQAVHEANQLRQMNARIGERLHQVEEELYRRSRSGSPIRAPMKALLSSEISMLSEAENWDVQASPPEPTLRPETTVSASPVRRDAPSPKHDSRLVSPPPKPAGRQVMWADASGNMVSFEMDPHAEREAF